MSSLGWGRLHGVGIEQLDVDHRIISNLAIQLDDALETDQSRDVVANIISVIAEFTRHHILRESAVWKDRGSVPSPSHQNDHKQLVAELDLIAARWSVGEWTMTEDMLRIRPFLNPSIHTHHSAEQSPATGLTGQSPTDPIFGSAAHGA